ncbi:isocitrate lyase/phosphoenolpyruvate mutase family protein [Fructobacillus ficulneus]|uniref:Uncharacterized protein n=1 Tax=Fructobacillus ficulneus TaxID=157463 RepID=A0A0K8MH32_9LACO|nr:isocitrate lyase/phosphoenolpyruvate mutase family protein [Fructobacillus ficulneus]GAO99468.1 hypothetical protein FFIC_140620 [Fructobacillus ficulneus]
MTYQTVVSAQAVKSASKNQYFYLSGRQLANQLLGEDNEGLLSLSEYLNYFDYLRVLTNKTFILDGQSGFGNPLNTYNSIKKMENHGADIILLNDQQYPSHSRPDQQKPAELAELAGKLKAAIDAHDAENTDLWIKFDCWNQYSQTEKWERLELLSVLSLSDIVLNEDADKLDESSLNIHYFAADEQEFLN